MPITSRCPRCGHSESFPDDWRGYRVRCQECQAPRTVSRKAATPRPPADFKSVVAKVWSWTRWPIRVFCMFAVIGALWGWATVWSLPGVAASHQVTQFDLVLRCVEYHTEHPLDPFHLLGANPAIQNGVAHVVHPLDDVTLISTTKKGPYRYEHTIVGGSRPDLVTTTPHLVAEPEELERAARGTEAMYPRSDAAAWEHLNQWGTALLLLNWERRNPTTEAEPAADIKPREGTEEEHLWLVWQVLSAGNPGAELDLGRLPAMVRKAYPGEDDSRAAMVWARTLYQRLRDTAWDYQQAHNVHDKATAYDKSLTARVKGATTWLPPETDTTMMWMLYQYVGLDDSSREFARRRWLGYFAHDKAGQVLGWGRALEAERRAAGEALPPGGDNVALLCVIERYQGTDGVGERARQAYRARWLATSRSVLGGYIQAAYPNDDVFLVLASGDRLRLMATEGPILFIVVLIVLMMAYGFHFCIITVLGEWILRLRDHPVYRRYREGRGDGTWLGRLVKYGVIPFAAWLLALFTIDTELGLLIESPWHLLLGVYVSVLLGGTMVGVLSRLLGVVLIRVGVNVEKTWLDEILGVTAGLLLLWHFGNGWLALTAFAAFELVPALVETWRPRETVPTLTAVPTVLPAE